MAAISTIPNLGPVMETALNDVGISTAQELRDIGADQAYAKLLGAGSRPHFIGYYVLVMALQGRPWNDCKGAEKAALRVKLDALKAGTHSETPPGIERFLDQIGTGTRRG